MKQMVRDEFFWRKIKTTSMHSSRMRTARLLTVSHSIRREGGVCLGGVCPGGVYPGGCVCPGGVCPQEVSAWGACLTR